MTTLTESVNFINSEYEFAITLLDICEQLKKQIQTFQFEDVRVKASKGVIEDVIKWAEASDALTVQDDPDDECVIYISLQ